MKLLLVLLLCWSPARGDMVSRLQHFSQELDGDSGGSLDEAIIKDLMNISTSWLRKKSYYTSSGIRQISEELNLMVGTASCKSDFGQMVTHLQLLAHVIQKSSHERRKVACTGTAALGERDVEWLLLDCRPKTAQNLQVFQQIGHHFSTGLQSLWKEDLEKELEEVLSDPVTAVFRKQLARSSPHSLPYTTEDSNNFVDAAISLMVFVVERMYNDTIRIPNIREGVRLNVVLLSLDTGFMANRGLVRQVSTLQRQGNARITRKNVTVHFAGSLHFQRLNIEYAEYKAAVLGVGPSGRLNLTVQPVTVGLQIRVDLDQRKAFLDSFRITSLGRSWLEVTGLGRGKLLGELTSCFLGLVRSHVLRFLEWRITSYTREALAKYSLDQILGGEFKA